MKPIAILLIFCAFWGDVAATTLEEDVVRYTAIFSGEKSQHAAAGESLAWMGISDTRVFDVIEKNLLAEGKTAIDDRNEKARIAWYIRSLGFSGQAKYETTINSFVKDPRYDGYARNALADMPNYRMWNPVVSNRANFDSKYSDEVNRTRNMLQSDDWFLKRLGAKRVYFGVYDEVLFELIARDLKAHMAMNDSKYSDCLAWLAKALQKNAAYKPLLQEVAEKATDYHVANHASLALQRMR
jgi:hypothetical protein